MKTYNSLITQTCAFLLFILSFLFINILSATEQTDQPIRKAAIFVDNRAGKAFDDKVPVLEDFITSRVTEQGFSVLSREVLINAFKDYSTEESKVSGTNVPESKLEQQLSDDVYALKMMQAIGEMFFGSFKGIPTEEPKVSSPEAPPVNLDQQLSRNSSALRLAQMMGADYIIAASITSFGMEKNGMCQWKLDTLLTSLVYFLKGYFLFRLINPGSQRHAWRFRGFSFESFRVVFKGTF